MNEHQPMKAETILEKYQLHKTPVRIEILSLLLSRDFAFPEDELRKTLSKDYDRTTVYRNIQTFVDLGILHQIIDDQKTIQFVLDKALANGTHTRTEHVHFKCEVCGRLFCLEDTPVKKYKLPDGFRKIKSDFLIIGVCDACNKNRF